MTGFTPHFSFVETLLAMADSRDKPLTVFVNPEQLAHLELMVSRGKASSVEEMIVRLIDRDRYQGGTPLDGFFGSAPAAAEDDEGLFDESPKSSGDSMWDNL